MDADKRKCLWFLSHPRPFAFIGGSPSSSPQRDADTRKCMSFPSHARSFASIFGCDHSRFSPSPPRMDADKRKYLFFLPHARPFAFICGSPHPSPNQHRIEGIVSIESPAEISCVQPKTTRRKNGRRATRPLFVLQSGRALFKRSMGQVFRFEQTSLAFPARREKRSPPPSAFRPLVQDGHILIVGIHTVPAPSGDLTHNSKPFEPSTRAAGRRK